VHRRALAAREAFHADATACGRWQRRLLIGGKGSGGGGGGDTCSSDGGGAPGDGGSVDVGASLNALGELLRLKGDGASVTEAVALNRRAHAIFEVTGAPLVNAVPYAHSLASPLISRCRVGSACTPLQRAFGPSHAHAALALNNLGLSLQAKGLALGGAAASADFEESRTALLAASEAWASVHGSRTHPQVPAKMLLCAACPRNLHGGDACRRTCCPLPGNVTATPWE